jgi:exodeoxyribonuclease V gamma subunit
VCLLGFDHDRFPRSSRKDGDDLLVDNEMIGDRDLAAEDRQLLLDAVMAARDHLLITYSGRDALTNTKLPAAVPVSELRETIASMVSKDAGDAVMTAHPLQPFSPDVFTDAKLGVAGPWGFDSVQFAGAVALGARDLDNDEDRPFTVSAAEPETPTLDRVIAYLRSPSTRFLRHNTGMYVPEIEEPPDDDLPTELDGLERWLLASRFLSGMGHGYDTDALIEYERALDSVPAGRLADAALDEALDLAQRIHRVASDRGCFAGDLVQFLGSATVNGVEIEGSVMADPTSGVVSDVTPSRGKANRRLALYARVVFLTALDPERPWRGILVGKGETKGDVLAVKVGPLGESAAERSSQAIARLADLVALHEQGMRQPLPIFTETSFAWQSAQPDAEFKAASKKWDGNSYFGIPGERDDDANLMLFPDLRTVGDLAASEFPHYADRLWTPILDVSRESTT